MVMLDISDQASKSQILSHLELALADLVATGRVTFLSQCRHQGEGRLVSLLEPDLTYQVEVRRKLVDATHCETRVPATTQPNFSVEAEVNFVPINGLRPSLSLLTPLSPFYLRSWRPARQL